MEMVITIGEINNNEEKTMNLLTTTWKERQNNRMAHYHRSAWHDAAEIALGAIAVVGTLLALMMV